MRNTEKAFGHFMLKYCYRKYLFLNCPNSNDMGVRILRYMHLLSSAIQKCTTTQCKNAPPYNAYLTEISNNPASLFCFNL